jgi:hypothetical protein
MDLTGRGGRWTAGLTGRGWAVDGRADRAGCAAGGRADPRCRGGYGRQMPVSTGGRPFGSWTGRAVSVRRGHTPGEADGRATILIVGPGCWPLASLVIAAARGFKVLISAEPHDSGDHNPINTGILPVTLPAQTVAELQAMVDCDPGILLTVDIFRQDVRVRGDLVGRFEQPPFWPGQPADGMAARLLKAQRLLGSAGLSGDDRSRLQRRLAAICDAMKAQGADEARIAWRLDRLLADAASRCQVRGRRTPADP